MEKYMMISLDDEKSRKLGEAISNTSCKKIINLLAEQELSASEISQKLNIKLSALDYNLKKLVASGIIEKSKHFWSVKGKKIPTYRVINKVIVIQPKKISNSNTYSKLKGISLMLCISAALTALVAWLTRNNLNYAVDEGLKTTESYAVPTGSNLVATTSTSASNLGFLASIQPWLWFAIGALVIIIIFLIVNWKKL